MRLVRVVLAVTAVLVLGAIGSATAAQAATVSGVVEGQQGSEKAERLPNVSVVFFQAEKEEEVAATTTNELGKYAVEVPSGVYDVRFEPKSPSPFEGVTVHKVEVGSKSQTLNVVLVAAGPEKPHLTGTVETAAGKPVSGATVILNGPSGKIVSFTGEDGSYSFEVPAGVYILSFHNNGESAELGLPDWHLTTKEFGLEEDRTVDLTLPATNQVTVEVLGNEEKPVAGAGVQSPAFSKLLELEGVGAATLLSEGPGRTTDESGRASFPAFNGSKQLGAGLVTPPESSGYESANYSVGAIEGNATVVVSLQSSPPDTEAPQLVEFAFGPSEIDTSSSTQFVSVGAFVTDDFSGLEKGVVFFRSPSGKQNTALLERIAGNANEGSYVAKVPFEQFSEAGVWRANVILNDAAGHQRDLGPEQLQAAGFESKLVVVSGEEPEPEPPVVTAIEPTSGPAAGGTAVQISGSGFGGAKQVSFGSAPATKFSVNSESSITAVSPAGTGTVDVRVTTPAGTSPTGAADQFTYSSQMTLTSSPNPSVHGQKVTFTAKVPSAEGGPTPLGTVAFVEGSNTLKVVNLSKGTATFNTTTLGAGKHPVVAQYSGDANYPPAESEQLTQVVLKAETQTTLVSSLNPAPFGSAATLKATVSAVAPGAGTPAGTVTFRNGETVLGTVQLSGANASLSLKTLPPGIYKVTASYSGDANDEPSGTAPVVQEIVKASTETALTSSLDPAPYGSSATLKASVDAIAPALGTPTGTVTFREGETILATVPLAGGSAKYALKTTAPGSYAITASYNGDTGYLPSEAATEQTITKATTEMTLSSSLNPAPYGSSATLKAEVDAVAPGGGTPSGSVTFWEGETVLATVPLASGNAKLALKSLPPGTHSIKATYSGDANYAPSLSGIEQTITKATTELTLTSSKNPAPKGASGNLKATVKTLAPGGGTATGTVVFREGETVLATIPLSGNSASYPLKSLPAGSHEITASYGGSANYEASADTLTQVITP